MKKLFIALTALALTLTSMAQVTKNLNVTAAGTLSSLLTADEKKSITDLNLTGNIDARDFKIIRDNLTKLSVLDISTITIQEYTGTAGTFDQYNSRTYPANELPMNSFCTNSMQGKASIKKVKLPSSITSVGDNAFYNSGLKIIYINKSTPPTCPYLGINATLYVPNSSTVETAYKSSYGWGSLTVIAEKRVIINIETAGSLAKNIISLGYGPIPSITHLKITGIINSDDLSQIKINMPSLTELDLSDVSINNNTIPANAFKDNTGLSLVLLPKNLVSIGDYAFAGCTSLTDSLSLPNTINTIGNYAFDGCTSISGKIQLPNSLVFLGKYAFQNCKCLIGDLLIPNTVGSIGDGTFSNCTSLNGSLYLGTLITSIGYRAFYYCGFNSELSLPNSLISIGAGAFFNCTKLNGNLTIPNSVTTIGSTAFYGCSGFKGTITLSNSLTQIDGFNGCSGLTGVLKIPISATSISSNAFSGCGSLKELYISKNITTIGDNAFGSFLKISVACTTPPVIYSNTFSNSNQSSCVLEIPIGTKLTYQTANYWSQFSLFSETLMADNYGINFQIGDNGKVMENNDVMGNNSTLIIDRGAYKVFNIVPNAGFEIANLTFNGVDVKPQLLNNKFTTPTINANSTFNVTFKKTQYRISIKDASSGTVNLLCEYGATPSFDFSPTNGWTVNAVFFNSIDVTNSMVDGVFTVPPITDNALLNVSFVADTPTGAAELIRSRIRVYCVNSEIIVEGLTEGETATLFTTNGKEINSFISKGEKIYIPANRETIYLLKTGLKVFKVIL